MRGREIEVSRLDAWPVDAWFKEQSSLRFIDPKVWTGLYLAEDRIARPRPPR